MTETPLSDTTHVLPNGNIVDPTIDKNPSHWFVDRDPAPDFRLVYFKNPDIRYFSYDPPKGFTAEEVVQFKGAKRCLSLEEASALIAERNEKGTLMITGDPRLYVPENRKAD